MTIPVVPDKLYFKIGEVSEIAGLEAYVLRYWQTEFAELSPGKSRHNQRLYKKSDVELVLRIKELLYKEKFTISGARTQLKKELKVKKTENNSQMALALDSPQKNSEHESFRKNLKEVLGNILREMHQIFL